MLTNRTRCGLGRRLRARLQKPMCGTSLRRSRNRRSDSAAVRRSGRRSSSLSNEARTLFERQFLNCRTRYSWQISSESAGRSMPTWVGAPQDCRGKMVSDRRAPLETDIKPAIRQIVEEVFRRGASVPVSPR